MSAAPEEASNKSKNQLNNRIPLEKRYGALGWDSIILHISQVG
jgi:hypothetical protein